MSNTAMTRLGRSASLTRSLHLESLDSILGTSPCMTVHLTAIVGIVA
jgi:hypothetical protein